MDGPDFADEVAVRLSNKFQQSCKKGDGPPIPNLGKVNRSAHFPIKLMETLTFALKQIDRDLFEKLRDGSLSLPQIIARIHLFQTGRTVAVLDDLRQDLHPSVLVKPSRYVEAAYEDMLLEKNLHKTAHKRGVDPAQLLESAK